MDYREYEVPSDLKRHVRYVWRLRLDKPSTEPRTIYPDGCCELVVHLGKPMSAFSPALGWLPQAETIFAAQQRGAVRLMAQGQTDCVGIRLMPAASASVVGGELANLRDTIIDLASVSPTLAAFLPRACGMFFDTGASEELWALLRQHVMPYPIDPRIEAATALLHDELGQSRIEAVAERMGMKWRTLQMRFLAEVGLGAKEFARILRLQTIIRRLDDEVGSLADAAAASGFSDQAHATRELQAMIGLTPARLVAALREDKDGDNAVRLAAAFVRGRV